MDHARKTELIATYRDGLAHERATVFDRHFDELTHVVKKLVRR